MDRRTLTIALASVLLIIGSPIIFMWGFISGGSSSQYWQINKVGLQIIVKDSLQSQYYHLTEAKTGLDTTRRLCAILFFDTEFFAASKNTATSLMAARKPGYMGNPHHLKIIKISAAKFAQANYVDVSNLFQNKVIEDNKEFKQEKFYLDRNLDEQLAYLPQKAYLFDNFGHLMSRFNQDNSQFEKVGDHDTYLKFNIDKTLFRSFGPIFKLKMKVEFSNKTIEGTYYYRLK